jgi:CYTH domain-containing protein
MTLDIPKYAKLEHERRFLVRDPPDLTGAPGRLIEDVYLDGGRLRLRRITHFDGHPPEYKLCKKYGTGEPPSEPITNLYLTAGEHAALAVLPGRPIRKRRYRVAHAGALFGLDVFEGELHGLVMCEAESDSAEAIRRRDFPPWTLREVTGEPFFTGGALAGLSASDLAARLGREFA